MRQKSHYRACESSSGFGEQQSHSHGSLFGTVKVRRTAGNLLSLQQTPDVHIYPFLSSSFACLFSHSVSLPLSPVWRKKQQKKKNWQSCVPVVKQLFSPITFLPFPRFSQMSPILCEDVRIMQMILAILKSWTVEICHFYLSLF